MQDNLRIYFKDKIHFESLIKKNRKFNCTIDSEDLKNDNPEALYYPIKGKIGSLVYVINPQSAYIENSIHKYYNLIMTGKEYNYNDFSYCDLVQTLDELLNEFPEYDFLDTKITSLEFGFNLAVDINVKDLIEKNVLLYNFKPHYVFEDNKNFVLKKFKSGNHIFKIYDKGRQNKLDYELLRVELKYNTKELKKLGIINFLDLYNPNKNLGLFNDFMKKFDDLIIIDDRFTEGLSKEEIANLGNKLEYSYWKRKDFSESTKSRHKKKLLKFIMDKKMDKKFLYIKDMIIQKFNQLFKDCNKSYPMLTTN
ncbi:hypothetical protein [Chryseobacterium taiwanense]|uniref:Uncharacterized protein n=1 Tax=Chryseobacterium taiwanense TaxID=363331 RepID=A0A0B4CZC5_9FLAO|nr:hypothetical protein [Chryseobacterium taiwanense]KIC61722.1 hypothetical protein RM51_15090 [Chryseobacterium taiwanense]